MGALITVAVLVFAGVGFAIGWFCRTAVSSRRSAAAGGALTAAAADALSRAYDDGFRAGYSSASAAAGVGPAQRMDMPVLVDGAARTGPPAPAGAPTSLSAPPPVSVPNSGQARISGPPPSRAPLGAPAAFSKPDPISPSAPYSAAGPFSPPMPFSAAGPFNPPQPHAPAPPPPSTHTLALPPAMQGPQGDRGFHAAGPGPVRPPSAEELAKRAAGEEARKRHRDLRNINITLYAACLLLVAAASLFIGLAIPEGARFAGVSLVAGLFYAGGLVVHARSRRLRPAAVAFTGTGLALVPVVGLALHNLVLRDAPLSWLVTSVVGTAAYAFAAARLESRVVAYLSMTFLLSTALASGASMRSGILWYFLFTVLMATAVSLVAMRRPAWLGNIYVAAFVQSHRALVPATAVVALLTAMELGGWQFSILFLAFACYYAVVFLQARRRERLFSSYGFRAAATIGLAVLASKLTDDAAAGILAASVLLLVQSAAVLALRRRYFALGGHAFFVSDYVIVLVLQVLAGLTAGLSAAGILPGGSTSQVLFTTTAVAVLLTCMAGAWKITAVSEAVPAGAVLIGFLAWLNGRSGTLWPAVVLLVLLVFYYTLRAVLSMRPAKEDYRLWTRATAVMLVSVGTMAVMETAGAGVREALIWSLCSTAAAVLLNQFASVYLLARRAAGGTAPGTSRESTRREVPALAVSAGLAALLTTMLRLTEYPEITVTPWVLFWALSANVVTSLVLRRFFRERPWLEWVGPAGFAAAAMVGAGVLGVRGYEVVTGAALVYSGFMVLHGARAGRRGGYLLAVQVLLTVMVALAAADLDLSVHGLFITVAVSVALQLVLRTLLQDHLAGAGVGALAATAQWGSAGALVLLPLINGGVAFRPLAGTVSVLLVIAAAGALFIQLSVMARRAADKPVLFPGGSLAGAAALVAALAVWLRLVDAPGAGLTVAVLFTALAANVMTSLTQPRLFPGKSWLQWIGPAGFAAVAAIGAGMLGVRGYEVLAAAAFGYCVFMVLRGARAEHRGVYLLAGQVLLTVLATLAAADLDLTVHGTFVAVAVSVAVQQVLRTLLHGRYSGAGLRQLGKAALWGSVAALTLLPLVYAAVTVDDARRHVVVISLSLLLGMAVTVSAADRNARILYPAVYALGMLPLVLTPVLGFGASGTISSGTADASAPLSIAAACALYLLLAAGALTAEACSAFGVGVRNILLAGGALYCIPALALAGMDGHLLLTGLGILLPAAGFLVVSFTRRIPWLTAVTVALAPGAAFSIRAWLVGDVPATALNGTSALLWSGFAAALLLYAVGYVLSVLPQDAAMELRGRILGSGAAVIAAGSGISAMPHENMSAVYGSVVLVAALAAAVREFPPAWREIAGEAAALVAALSVQRILWYTTDGAGWFWLLQYWVVILTALAAYEYRRGRAPRGTAVLSVAAGLLSATGLTSIISADTSEQVWALLAHSGLLAFGVVTNRRLFTFWGAAGVALAVLWYLRGYTFLLLALLAAALIALAVWRLTRVRPDTVPEADG